MALTHTAQADVERIAHAAAARTGAGADTAGDVLSDAEDPDAAHASHTPT